MTPLKQKLPTTYTESPTTKRQRLVFVVPFKDVTNVTNGLKQKEKVSVKLATPNKSEEHSMYVYVSKKTPNESHTSPLPRVLFPASVSQQNDAMQEMRNEMRKMQEGMERLTEKNNQLTREVTELTKEVTELTKEVTELKVTVNSHESSISALQEQVEGLQEAGIYFSEMILGLDSQLTLVLAGLGLREVYDRVTKDFFGQWKDHLQNRHNTKIDDFYKLIDGMQSTTLTGVESAALVTLLSNQLVSRRLEPGVSL